MDMLKSDIPRHYMHKKKNIRKIKQLWTGYFRKLLQSMMRRRLQISHQTMMGIKLIIPLTNNTREFMLPSSLYLNSTSSQ